MEVPDDKPSASGEATAPTSNTGRPSPETAVSNPFRLAFVLVCLAVVLGGPLIIGRFRYYSTYNALKAEADVASEELGELKPRLQDFVLASRLVAKRVSPSVVSIYRPGPRGPLGQGSGVIVASDGYIVTNFHVISDLRQTGSNRLRVRLSDGREHAAKVVGVDPATDLAVLKVNVPNLIAAEWGDSDQLEVGDLVWAVGSPFGLERSITFGIVSAKTRRSGSGVTRTPYQEYLQTDAAVNPGNSGGPLVDVEGKVVGINSAIVGPSYQGVSFAIPSSLAHEKYEQMLRNGWVERGYLGVKPRHVPPDVQQRLGLSPEEGVYVGHVQPGEPAFQAGIRRGDVILQWNDHVATDPTLLSRAIAASVVGSTAHVVLVRDDHTGAGADQRAERLELDVVVGSHPDLKKPEL